MSKRKKLCYICNTNHYLKSFSGVGKKRNNICNICLFKDSRKPIYMTDKELEESNEVNDGRNKPKLGCDAYNEVIEDNGYWFEEE